MRAVERGDFDDTDDFVAVVGKAGKSLGIKKVAALDHLDVSECKPLKSEQQRREFAEKLK